MLHASERFGRIIVLIVNMDIIVTDRLSDFLTQEIVVDKRLCGLAGEFHHHAGRCVRIHIGILACDIRTFDVYNVKKHVAGLCLARNRPLVAVLNVFLSHIFSAAAHQLALHGILNLLHAHLLLTMQGDKAGDAFSQTGILASLRVLHRLADGSHNFHLIETV